jgi:mycothiol S-conjugate amidase
MTDLGILAVYAHPDDEQGVSGTLAKYVREGVRAGLICATRGEMGEIADPALATPETLGAVRERELRDAAAILGVEPVWFLDYRDSGMAGTAGNDDPRAFMNADGDKVVGRLVRIIREFKPQALVTFDATGGYGHPDHIAIHRWATEAFAAAGDPARYPEAGPAWQPDRLFYGSIPRSALRRMVKLFTESGLESAFTGMDPEQMGMPDEDVTNVADVSAYVDLKMDSLRRHATQLPANSPFARLPVEATRKMRGTEHFMLAAGTPLPAGADPGDLLAGLR